jgi:YHS domain-containing protein
MKSILTTTAFTALAIMGGCNGNPQSEHDDHDHEHHEEMEAEKGHDHSQMEEHQTEMDSGVSAEQMEQQDKMHTQSNTGSYAVGDHVPTKQVCMVNDAYMAKDQIPVPVNDKTYYGCCQMCVKTLNEQETARIGTDPLTGEKVDKTEAYIVLLKDDGTVGYFKSEENYMTYKARK